MIFFFFSSRRRHTRCGRDWSSDVCSSDLGCILHIAEISRRKGELERGYPNLFEYCVRRLNLSEGSVALRIQVAKVARPKPAFEPSIRKRPSSAIKGERNSSGEEGSGTALPLEEASPLQRGRSPRAG